MNSHSVSRECQPIRRPTTAPGRSRRGLTRAEPRGYGRAKDHLRRRPAWRTSRPWPTWRSRSPTSTAASPGTPRCSAATPCSTRTPVRSGTSSGSLGRQLLGLHKFPDLVDAAPFEERRPGLDHVAFACADRAELAAWADRLDELGIAHGGIVDAGYGSGVSFRDPDNIALEFFAPPG